MATVTRHAPNGMVATVDHLASTAGLGLLQRGGSAADAAVAASAVLAVTAPHLCGMGGDLFAIVHPPAGGPPAALTAAGRAGSGADPARLRAEGRTTMPLTGDVRSAPVPGCVDGWVALHERFGRLPLAEVLGPAAAYAREGFPASPLLAALVPELVGVPGAEDLAGDGRRRAGTRVTRPGVAAALDAIVAEGRRGFYEGAFGAGLLALGNGEYGRDDLRRPLADWVEPLHARVWGHDVWTAPPCSQGYLVVLGALIAEGLPLPHDPADARWAHLLVEAARAAGWDRPAVLHEAADVRPLLTPAAVEARRGLVDPDRRSSLPSLGAPGGTMHLCAVDRDGMAVSLIQSNAMRFGSLVFEPATGIGLHNRGLGFTLEAGHPAEYGPGRRPPHTLSPAMVTRPDGSLRAAIGTMGGDSQPQILLQLLARLLHHGHDPGRAIGAPRWALAAVGTGFETWTATEVKVAVEPEAADGWAAGLRERGHEVAVEPFGAHFGHAQLIERGADGILGGAADPRAFVGLAAGY